MAEDTELPRVVARSFVEAERELPGLVPGIGVISIGRPGSRPPRGFNRRSGAHLRLEFDDVVRADPPPTGDREIQPPTREDVEQLLEHAEGLCDEDLVYCHCRAGVSRSVAAAFVVLCSWREPGRERDCLRRIDEETSAVSPNSLVVRYADDVLGRDGAMVEVVNECTRG